MNASVQNRPFSENQYTVEPPLYAGSAANIQQFPSTGTENYFTESLYLLSSCNILVTIVLAILTPFKCPEHAIPCWALFILGGEQLMKFRYDLISGSAKRLIITIQCEM